MYKYVVIEKKVGETPLQCAENWRATQSPALTDVPLAYAGRLDPMASGKLLVLIGDECKRQSKYHKLDKTYEFEVLFGVQSDSGDVLGLVESCDAPELSEAELKRVARELTGTVTLPYPKFSSKTVNGKPLHTWTLEGRLNEIEIPTYSATIYNLKLLELRTVPKADVVAAALEKIGTIPPVTDERKAIGNDFRRPDVFATWHNLNGGVRPLHLQVARFRCTGSSGLYMRTLAEVIAGEVGTCGLAYSIHRTHIGMYQPLPFGLGFWLKKF